MVRSRFINKLGNKTKIEMEEINQNSTFILVYLIILIVGILLFTFSNYGLIESIFEFTSALGTIGLSYGIIGSSPSNLILTVSIIGMMIARLESYILIVAFTKLIVDFRHKIERSKK